MLPCLPQVLKCATPVLVDFWAPWCGPCRMIAPLIDEIASEYGSRLKCVKVNTDESPGVATEYGIRSIPTVMLFKGESWIVCGCVGDLAVVLLPGSHCPGANSCSASNISVLLPG